MDHNSQLFLTALRDACNRALADGRVGEQTGHIETIELIDKGSPLLFRVTCFGNYSPTESSRVYDKDQGIVQVMDMVGRFMAGRAVYDLSFTELK